MPKFQGWKIGATLTPEQADEFEPLVDIFTDVLALRTQVQAISGQKLVMGKILEMTNNLGVIANGWLTIREIEEVYNVGAPSLDDIEMVREAYTTLYKTLLVQVMSAMDISLTVLKAGAYLNNDE